MIWLVRIHAKDEVYSYISYSDYWVTAEENALEEFDFDYDHIETVEFNQSEHGEPTNYLEI